MPASRDRPTVLGYIGDNRVTPERAIYATMKARCKNKKHAMYKNYGGRGIVVCERWANSFAAFIEDMGPRPSSHHSIERKDADGDYEPSNCCWATPVAQSRHQRSNVRVEWQGKTMCISEWSLELSMAYHTLYGRIVTHKWTVERAFTTPLRTFGGERISISFDGVTKTLVEWATALDVSTASLLYRIHRGLPIEQVLARHAE